MKLKKNLIILIFLLTTITLSIINLKNTSKTYLYFLNFKTEKLTLGSFITLSFLAGFTSTFTFSYLTSSKNVNKMLIVLFFQISKLATNKLINCNNKKSKNLIMKFFNFYNNK